ncbi:MAG: T9SS type A sorting domain-containing protein, partial [Bacteroidota bacterium]
NYYYEQFVGIQDLVPVAHQIGPNPSRGILNLTFGTVATATELTLFDMQGRIIGRAIANPNETQLQWEAPMNLPNGIYPYRLTQGEKASTGKVILQR